MSKNNTSGAMLLLVMALAICFSSFSVVNARAEDAGKPTGNELMSNICSTRAEKARAKAIENPMQVSPMNVYSKYAIDENGDYFIDSAKYSGKTDRLMGYCKFEKEYSRGRSVYSNEDEKKLYVMKYLQAHVFDQECEFQFKYDSPNRFSYGTKGIGFQDFNNGRYTTLLFACEDYAFIRYRGNSKEGLGKLSFDKRHGEILFSGNRVITIDAAKHLFAVISEPEKGEDAQEQATTVSGMFVDLCGDEPLTSTVKNATNFVFWGGKVCVLVCDENGNNNLCLLSDDEVQEVIIPNLKGDIIGATDDCMWTIEEADDHSFTVWCYKEKADRTEALKLKCKPEFLTECRNGRILARVGTLISVMDMFEGTFNLKDYAYPASGGFEAIYDCANHTRYMLNHPFLFAQKDGEEKVVCANVYEFLSSPGHVPVNDGAFKVDAADNTVCFFATDFTATEGNAKKLVYTVTLQQGKISLKLDKARDADAIAAQEFIANSNPEMRRVIAAMPGRNYLGSLGGEHYALDVAASTILVLDKDCNELRSYKLPHTAAQCAQVITKDVFIIRYSKWSNALYNIKTGDFIRSGVRIHFDGNHLFFTTYHWSGFKMYRFHVNDLVFYYTQYKCLDGVHPRTFQEIAQGGSGKALFFDAAFASWLTLEWNAVSEDSEYEEKRLEEKLKRICETQAGEKK